MPKAHINNIAVQVDPGTTILDAARKVSVKIPTLCKHSDLLPSAACGVCVVKLKGSGKMMRACSTPIEDRMDITTHDAEIIEVRKTVVELILSAHPNDCQI